jgi:hypothetical protein
MQIVERSSSSNGAGFVLISFGSIAKLEDMPNSMRRDLFQVLLETRNITFIVKYKTDDSIERYAPNIYMSKWLPQVQLMGKTRNISPKKRVFGYLFNFSKVCSTIIMLTCLSAS